MRRLRNSAFRVATTLVVAFSLLFSLGEEVIADVHDGGATRAEVARITGATQQAGSSLASHHVDSSAPTTSDHSVHVCHCSHVHGGVVAMTSLEPAVLLPAVERVAVFTSRRPPATALEFPSRPPIG